MQAGVQDGGWLAVVVVAGSVVTSLLTLYAVARVWARVFWGEAQEGLAGSGPFRGGHHHALSLGTVLPAAALVGASLLLTLVAGPLFNVTSRAAADLLLRSPYLVAVLGGVPS